MSAVALTALLMSSCGENKGESTELADDLELNTITADTVCTLFGGKGGPACTISYKLKYAEGTNADDFNRIITGRLFPQSSDSLDVEKSVHNELLQIIDDYKKTLTGVTKKSIADGSFPVSFATYRRFVNAECSKVKNEILSYKAFYEEKAYGEKDSLVSINSFNVSLTDRKLITKSDIFVPGSSERLGMKIAGKLFAEYGVKDLAGLQRKGIFVDGIPYATDNIEISDKDITFIYNPFEIAGRKYGIINVVVPADELKDIMKKEWIAFFEKK